MADKTKIIAVVGPTASGKSDLAVALAEKLSGEVVSCDSMQIYRQLDIGTAKPAAEDMKGIPHHLIDCVEPDVNFSCADYVDLADKAVSEIVQHGRIPVFCGGTGLYLDSFLRGGFTPEVETDEKYRSGLMDFAERYGNEALHAELEKIDSEAAGKIHPNNVKRVIRALEIYHLNGINKTEMDKKNLALEQKYDACVIGIGFSGRELLYDRINKRVDIMMKKGLVEETAKLLSCGVFEKSKTAAKAIGYKEIIPYVKGEITLDEAAEELKKATRRYAKRQLTWFGAKDYVKWVYADENGKMRNFSDIVEDALELCARFL